MSYGLLTLALAAIAGLGLGFFYFGTLWLTVRRIQDLKRPQFLLILSFWLRIGITLLGFYVVMVENWKRLMACVCGFLIMRQMMVKKLSPEREYLRRKSYEH